MSLLTINPAQALFATCTNSTEKSQSKLLWVVVRIIPRSGFPRSGIFLAKNGLLCPSEAFLSAVALAKLEAKEGGAAFDGKTDNLYGLISKSLIRV